MDIWERTTQIARVQIHGRHYMGYSFRLAARVLSYAPSHRRDSTYHGIYLFLSTHKQYFIFTHTHTHIIVKRSNNDGGDDDNDGDDNNNNNNNIDDISS